MVVAAVNWSLDRDLSRDQIFAAPGLAHYVAGWPRRGDLGVVAEADERPVGRHGCGSFPPPILDADSYPPTCRSYPSAWQPSGVAGEWDGLCCEPSPTGHGSRASGRLASASGGRTTRMAVPRRGLQDCRLQRRQLRHHDQGTLRIKLGAPISVPLTTDKDGARRPPPGTQVGSSGAMTACSVQILELIVRVL
jgi:hypothetical protein